MCCHEDIFKKPITSGSEQDVSGQMKAGVMARYKIVLNLENIREIMRIREWKQVDLARESGLTPATISQVFNKKREMSGDTFYSLYKALGLPIYKMTKEL